MAAASRRLYADLSGLSADTVRGQMPHPAAGDNLFRNNELTET